MSPCNACCCLAPSIRGGKKENIARAQFGGKRKNQRRVAGKISRSIIIPCTFSSSQAVWSEGRYLFNCRVLNFCPGVLTFLRFTGKKEREERGEKRILPARRKSHFYGSENLGVNKIKRINLASEVKLAS